MKTLFTASVELAVAGGAFAAGGRWLDHPAMHRLAPIGYLLLIGGGLLMLVLGVAWLSLQRETTHSAEEPD